MNDVLNPVQVEQAIREAANTVAEGVAVVSQRLEAFRSATRTFDLAFARAYMKATGPVAERKYTADIETMAERQDMDVAEVAFKFASSRAKSAELTLSAFQTLSRSVSQMYSAAGTGEY